MPADTESVLSPTRDSSIRGDLLIVILLYANTPVKSLGETNHGNSRIT